MIITISRTQATKVLTSRLPVIKKGTIQTCSHRPKVLFHFSKKSPEGPTEQTPNTPDFLIAPTQPFLGVRYLATHRQGYRVTFLHMGNGWVTL